MKHKITSLLRWSEKYTKTDMVYVFSGGFWLSVGQGVAMIAGLILAIAFANFVPKEVYGNYKFILALVGVITAFTLTGMDTAITQAVARGFDGSLREGFKEKLKWSVPVFVIAIAISLYYFINDNSVLSLSMLIAGVSLPFLLSSVLFSAFLKGKKFFKESTIYNSIRNTVPPLLLIPTILLTHNVILIVLVYFVATTLTNLFFYFYTLRKYAPSKKTDATTLNYSKHLSFMNVLGKVAQHIDKILIFHFFGAVELAVYAFATVIPNELKNVNKVISALVLPKLSAKKADVILKTLPRKSLIAAIGIILLVIAYIPLAPIIFAVLFPAYSEAVIFSQIYALGILALPAGIFRDALLAHKKKTALYIMRTTIPVVRIIALLILLPLYGIWGAIAAYLIKNLYSAISAIALFFIYLPRGERSLS